MRQVQVVLVAEADGTHRARVLDAGRDGPDLRVDDLPGWVAATEREHRPRWVLTTAELYPALLAAGVRVQRCHDMELTEAILLAFAGEPGRPRNPAAAYARLTTGPEPPDPGPPDGWLAERANQPSLFEPDRRPHIPGVRQVDVVAAVFADQLRRIDATAHPDRLRLLVAAESAGALAAAELTHTGLPWRADVHEKMLTDRLGPRPPSGGRPKVLEELAAEIAEALGSRSGGPVGAVNPDNPASVVRAFARAGVEIPSTRAWVLREIDHPAIAPLLRYKELSRIHVAHGWSWLETWVRDGRFRADYVVGGVVSGRWATRGGAGLQLPRLLRTAVRADPGWSLVVADAAQLEPRVLAALSGDRRLAEVSTSVDLYTSLASDAFAGDRGKAKIAMLSAMYGGTSGEAGPLLVLLRKRFPQAVSYVEEAASAGEQGRTVRSRLGRTSPPASEGRQEVMAAVDTDERRSRQAAREWGRFTRNFVVQASAADWALTVLAILRLRLPRPAELVFFQHDEVLVHCPTDLAPIVSQVIAEAAAEATTLVFGTTGVRFPLEAVVVDCYADAK